MNVLPSELNINWEIIPAGSSGYPSINLTVTNRSDFNGTITGHINVMLEYFSAAETLQPTPSFQIGFGSSKLANGTMGGFTAKFVNGQCVIPFSWDISSYPEASGMSFSGYSLRVDWFELINISPEPFTIKSYSPTLSNLPDPYEHYF